MKISILCPTRKRPDNMERLTNSVYNLALNPETVEVIFYIDDDDSDSSAKVKVLEERFPGRIRAIFGPRIVLSKMWNECHKVAEADIFMHCGDDIIIRTTEWDKIVSEKFDETPDKIAFIYGDDMNPGISKDFGTHGFIHRNWTDTVGYFVPPYFSSDWNDTWLNDVAKMLGRHYLVPIQTEHMHPGAGKGVYDITHQERLARGRRDNVEYIYRSLRHERQEDVDKLEEFIEEYSENTKSNNGG